MLPYLGSAVEGTPSGAVDVLATALSIDSLPEDDGAVPILTSNWLSRTIVSVRVKVLDEFTLGAHDQDILVNHLYDDIWRPLDIEGIKFRSQVTGYDVSS